MARERIAGIYFPNRLDVQRRIAKLGNVDRHRIIEQLWDWFDAATAPPVEKPEFPVRKGNVPIRAHKRGDETLRLERVRCGKDGCKCNGGALHGPYWYGYKRITAGTYKGRIVSRYIGKELPAS